MTFYYDMQCSFERRVAQFAKHGRVADILAYLRQVFEYCAVPI